jgi:hypothetical protein
MLILIDDHTLILDQIYIALFHILFQKVNNGTFKLYNNSISIPYYFLFTQVLSYA